MNKKGFVKQMLVLLGILVLVIAAIAGITAYQAYRVYRTMMDENQNMQNSASLMKKDIEAKDMQSACARASEMETSLNKIQWEIESACANPLIKVLIKKLMASQTASAAEVGAEISCENLKSIYSESAKNFASVNAVCGNASA